MIKKTFSLDLLPSVCDVCDEKALSVSFRWVTTNENRRRKNKNLKGRAAKSPYDIALIAAKKSNFSQTVVDWQSEWKHF
jgi:hypothetical protein